MTGDEATETTFRERMRSHRQARGWSQARLAEEVRKYGPPWHQATTSRVEVGTQPVALAEAVAVARAFGVPLTDLLAPVEPEEYGEGMAKAEAVVTTLEARLSEAGAAVALAMATRAEAEARSAEAAAQLTTARTAEADATARHAMIREQLAVARVAVERYRRQNTAAARAAVRERREAAAGRHGRATVRRSVEFHDTPGIMRAYGTLDAVATVTVTNMPGGAGISPGDSVTLVVPAAEGDQ